MDNSWVARRIAEAQAAVKGTPNDVPDAVAKEFAALLADGLQSRLKPEDVKSIVARLAAANRRVE
jgi:hypothetical protein